jgi:hypothetical protein
MTLVILEVGGWKLETGSWKLEYRLQPVVLDIGGCRLILKEASHSLYSRRFSERL